MAIPSYEEIMLPFLKLIPEDKTIELQKLRELLIEEFKLTEEERLERIASGGQLLIYNRIGWASTYLKKAGLIEVPLRGSYKITEEGKKHLSEYLLRGSKSITTKDLEKISIFKDFQNKINSKDNLEAKSKHEFKQTPTDEILQKHNELKNELVDEILEKLKICDPHRVQRIALDVALKILDCDINNAEPGQKGPDGGIDGIIYKDALKLDAVYLQVKRQESKVDNQALQKFSGAISGRDGNNAKGIFITTSEFANGIETVLEGKKSKKIVTFFKSNGAKIILISGREFATYMWEYDIGVRNEQTYVTKKIDEDYFEEK